MAFDVTKIAQQVVAWRNSPAGQSQDSEWKGKNGASYVRRLGLSIAFAMPGKTMRGEHLALVLEKIKELESLSS